ncbi:MAG: FlgD immunoglobulin-like domain containing protein, partial [Puniceicoccales bacterium]
MNTRLLLALCAAPLALPTSVFSAGAESPTSNNRQIMAVPAPGKVIIDGQSEDWDLSAGIWSYNDPTLVDKYSTWTHVMYDDQGVYLLIRYRDDTPMKNDTRGEDFHQSWQADAFQGRVIFDYETDDQRQMHINGFYSSEEDRPYMIVHHGGLKKKPPYDSTGPYREDLVEKYGVTMDEHGGGIAFAEWEDGRGYNLEAFWPWSYVRNSGQPLKPGETFVLGLEAIWGNPEGDTVEHRLADNLRNDSVNRIFFFRALTGWGEVVISEQGDLDITEQQKELQTERLREFENIETFGSMPIRYTLPSEREVTIAIDNAEGVRVRNLFGEFPRPAGENVDYWDGLDDSGNPVPAGEYTATIVDHEPITLELINAVYNSATPPWRTENGFLSWGSNHGHPTSVTTRGDVTIFGFTGTEGTAGVLRKDAGENIKWIEVTESLDVTMDDDYVYLLSRESWTQKAMVRKLDANTGDIVLFENDDRSAESILPIEYRKAVNGSTIAYADGQIFIFVPGEGLWR